MVAKSLNILTAKPVNNTVSNVQKYNDTEAKYSSYTDPEFHSLYANKFMDANLIAICWTTQLLQFPVLAEIIMEN